ncbi:MAG: sugar transferase [Bacillota bacterium]|nr:sugar transferase [Bacillota bacterium]
MFQKDWNELPEELRNDKVKVYYDILSHKKCSLLFKRVIDFILSIILILLLLVPMIVIAIIIKLTSRGPVIFKQERITTYVKKFQIYKFRTMVQDADKKGSLVTVAGDSRITNVGRFLRKYRLDEIPQLFNVLAGSMSFVGTRPEVKRFVDHYTDEMMATLLMPAGVTSLASITFKDEDSMFKTQKEIDDEYINIILPQKMVYNLEYIEKYRFLNDIKLIFKTVANIFS